MKNYVQLSFFKFGISQEWSALDESQKKNISSFFYYSNSPPQVIRKICWGIIANFKKRNLFSFFYHILSTDFDKKICEESFTKFIASDYVILKNGEILEFSKPFRFIQFIRVQQLIAGVNEANFKEVAREIVAVAYQKNKADKYSDEAMKLHYELIENYNEHFLLDAAQKAIEHCKQLSITYYRLFDNNYGVDKKEKTPPHIIFEKWLKTARMMSENVSQIMEVLQLDCHLAFFELQELKDKIQNKTKK